MLQIVKIILIVSSIVYSKKLNKDYCSLKCNNGAVSVGCKCEEFSKCHLMQDNLDDFRQWVLDKHNELRNTIASGGDTRAGATSAANMNKLVYDKELEYLAECHLKKCPVSSDEAHDKCRISSKWGNGGQNMAFHTASVTEEKIVKRSIQLWYDEINEVNNTAFIDKYEPEKGTGHFSQVIWAKTTHIGCARSHTSNSGYLGKLPFYFGCNYGVSGNYIQAPIYKRGKPCSKCENKKKCDAKYTSLCS